MYTVMCNIVHIFIFFPFAFLYVGEQQDSAGYARLHLSHMAIHYGDLWDYGSIMWDEEFLYIYVFPFFFA